MMLIAAQMPPIEREWIAFLFFLMAPAAAYLLACVPSSLDYKVSWVAISLTGMHCCYAEVYILIQQVSHMNKNRKIQVLNLRTMNDIIKGNALSGVAIPK